MEIGKGIKELMERKGISLKDLSIKTGISETILVTIIDDQKKPKKLTIKLICRALDVPTPYLLLASFRPFGVMGQFTEGELEWIIKTAPAIVRRQIKQIIEVVLPKLKWYDRFLFKRYVWFAKRNWSRIFFLWWFKRKIIFHEFKLNFEMKERFFLFEKVQIYNRFYDLELPL